MASTTSGSPPSCARPTASGPEGLLRTLIDVELIGLERVPGLDAADARRLCEVALASGGVHDGHVAVAFVGEDEIRQLNRIHRDRDAATDVLSFPVDEAGPSPGPRELGDVVICPERTEDLREAVVHGALHLVGMNHETDDGEMLALQAEILGWE